MGRIVASCLCASMMACGGDPGGDAGTEGFSTELTDVTGAETEETGFEDPCDPLRLEAWFGPKPVCLGGDLGTTALGFESRWLDEVGLGCEGALRLTVGDAELDGNDDLLAWSDSTLAVLRLVDGAWERSEFPLFSDEYARNDYHLMDLDADGEVDIVKFPGLGCCTGNSVSVGVLWSMAGEWETFPISPPDRRHFVLRRAGGDSIIYGGNGDARQVRYEGGEFIEEIVAAELQDVIGIGDADADGELDLLGWTLVDFQFTPAIALGGDFSSVILGPVQGGMFPPGAAAVARRGPGEAPMILYGAPSTSQGVLLRYRVQGAALAFESYELELHQSPSQLHAADFDGDGLDDLLMAGGSSWDPEVGWGGPQLTQIGMQSNSGEFAFTGFVDVRGDDRLLVPVRTGDGSPDLLVSGYGPSALEISLACGG